MKTSTQQWLEFAKADLRNCERIIDDNFLTHIVAFHSQQAVEKSFKALIEEKNLVIPRVHSLIRLNNIIEQFLEFPFETRELLALDNVYINSRYPSDLGLLETGKPSQQEAQELYESAERIFNIILKQLEY